MIDSGLGFEGRIAHRPRQGRAMAVD